jgi:hypothetical protein
MLTHAPTYIADFAPRQNPRQPLNTAPRPSTRNPREKPARPANRPPSLSHSQPMQPGREARAIFYSAALVLPGLQHLPPSWRNTAPASIAVPGFPDVPFLNFRAAVADYFELVPTGGLSLCRSPPTRARAAVRGWVGFWRGGAGGGVRRRRRSRRSLVALVARSFQLLLERFMNVAASDTRTRGERVRGGVKIHDLSHELCRDPRGA